MVGCRVIYAVLPHTHKSASTQHQTKLVYGPFQPVDRGYWMADLKAAVLHIAEEKMVGKNSKVGWDASKIYSLALSIENTHQKNQSPKNILIW